MVQWIFWVLLGALGLQRIAELHLSRRNAQRLVARGGHLVAEDVYPAIVALHVGFFLAAGLEALVSPRAGLGWWTLVGMAAFLVGQGIRYSSMLTLGDRWTTRIYVVPGEPPVDRGLYRWLDHPIYVGVVLELLAFPLAFGLYGTAVVATVLNLWLLRQRIAHEEAALRAAAGAPAGAGAGEEAGAGSGGTVEGGR